MKLWIPFGFWRFFKIVCLERGHGVLGFVIASDRKGVEYIFSTYFGMILSTGMDLLQNKFGYSPSIKDMVASLVESAGLP